MYIDGISEVTCIERVLNPESIPRDKMKLLLLSNHLIEFVNSDESLSINYFNVFSNKEIESFIERLKYELAKSKLLTIHIITNDILYSVNGHEDKNILVYSLVDDFNIRTKSETNETELKRVINFLNFNYKKFIVELGLEGVL